jgi:hypothetical protein
MALKLTFQKLKNGKLGEVDEDGKEQEIRGPFKKDARLEPGEYIVDVKALRAGGSKNPKNKGTQLLTLQARVVEAEGDDAAKALEGKDIFVCVSDKSFGFLKACLTLTASVQGLTFDDFSTKSEADINADLAKYLDVKGESPAVGARIGIVAHKTRSGYLEMAFLAVKEG